MTSIYRRAFITLGLSLTMITPSLAAIEIDEEGFGPSYDTMVVDTVVGKPLQLLSAVAGTASFVASLPFTIAGQSTEMAKQKLVVEPWYAMQRCLGCTVAEDKFYKTQPVNSNLVRIVVDQPSEILINTNDKVVVIPQ